MDKKITYDDVLELWQGFKIKDSKTLSAYLENFAVLFSYHSAAIENSEVTYMATHEIFNNGKVINYTGNLRTLYEISNMKDGYKLMFSWYDKRKKITKEGICEMHYELTKGTFDERRWELGERPGEFKKNDIWGVGQYDVAAPVEEIERNIETDLKEIADVSDENALIAATFFHARFEGIHPFADGNGRVGRAIMNYFLILHNHPPIIVHREDCGEYYSSLNKFDETGDLKPLETFFKEQTAETWEKVALRYKAAKNNITHINSDSLTR